MATITLGNIKFNWKGAYNSSTAYVVDDVVSLSGSSYVCIQAGTNKNPASQSAYWEQMSSAGTNGSDGTDIGTTITTQGDLLYRDGSGLQRLPKGTAGQVLQMNSGATAPEYGNVSSDFVKLGQTGAVSDVSDVNLNGFFSSDYKIYKVFGYGIYGNSQGNGFSWKANTGSGYSTQSGGSYIYANDGYYRSSGGQSNNSNHSWNDTNGCRLGWSGGGSDHENAIEITFYEPQSTTEFKKASFSSVGWDGSSSLVGMTGGGEWRDKTAMTGIHIYCYSGNMWANNFIIYGIKS